MKYLVIYTSKTGNTQKIALEIFQTLPVKSKDIQRLEEFNGEEADTYFVGFWNDRGTCEKGIIEFLASLHGKKIALFGTCGMGGNQDYFDQVAACVAAFIPEDNQYIGHFMCAGKMLPQVLKKYKRIQKNTDSPEIRQMIHAYEIGMLHPDESDFQAVRKFTEQMMIESQEGETDGKKRRKTWVR